MNLLEAVIGVKCPLAPTGRGLGVQPVGWQHHEDEVRVELLLWFELSFLVFWFHTCNRTSVSLEAITKAHQEKVPRHGIWWRRLHCNHHSVVTVTQGSRYLGDEVLCFQSIFLPSLFNTGLPNSLLSSISPLGLCLLIQSTPDSLSSVYLRRDAAGEYVRPSLIRGQTSEHRGSTFLVAKPVGRVPRTEGPGAPVLSEIPDQLYSHALCRSLPLRKKSQYLDRETSKPNAAPGIRRWADQTFFRPVVP